MTQIKSCSIKILNKNYEIKCPEGEEYHLLLAEEKLNQHIAMNKAKNKQLDDFHSLLLAAIDISYELVLCKSKPILQKHQVSQLINFLENKINEMINNELDSISEMD